GQQPSTYEMLASHAKTPADLLRKLLFNPIQTEYLLLALARNPNTPFDCQKRLQKTGDRMVRTFMARQTKIAPEILMDLASDGDLGVKSYAASNPATPSGSLIELA